MDFIERIFGISPDGGTGSLEMLLFALPIMGVIAIVAWRRGGRARKR
jgi:hypothetical protein